MYLNFIHRRLVELRSELHSQDIKRIQLRLQGSVSVQVNQGPLAYARAFLEKENDYPIEDIHRLKTIFRCVKCIIAIKMCKYVHKILT